MSDGMHIRRENLGSGMGWGVPGQQQCHVRAHVCMHAYNTS